MNIKLEGTAQELKSAIHALQNSFVIESCQAVPNVGSNTFRVYVTAHVSSLIPEPSQLICKKHLRKQIVLTLKTIQLE